MRRSLTLTVAAATTMVLLAMLVPMAVLLRSYVLEDRLARAAVEVQATESVVSTNDKGQISQYVDRINGDDGNQTTVVMPDGDVIGPAPSDDERARIIEARNSNTARVDDVDGGTAILVPVSLGRSTAAPAQSPVVRVFVPTPGLERELVRSWAILLALGVALLLGALLLADRLGRSFVSPLRDLADYATRLGRDVSPEPPPAAGPTEVQDLGVALHRLVDRVEDLLARERAGIADLSHRLRTPMTALRLRIDAIADPGDRARLAADLDDLRATVDAVVRDARRAERAGLTGVADGVAVLAARVRYWEPLAEEQGRSFSVQVTDKGPVGVRAGADELEALVDVLLDNVFSHTPDDAAITVSVTPGQGGLVLVVEDAGPGLRDAVAVADRGASGGGSTGLGLAIADRTATESGGSLALGRSVALGGARIEVVLGLG
ncbi:sensor histidine kinase [Nocardioides sp. C4-1]|uniref:sensor histidine kinase n=1 Tax=Nocardioides sp. C4-1 TaxID=3151851 RepID=UPI003262E567